MSDHPYELIVGLETHVQLLTETKLFCGCSTKFGAPPNTQTCPGMHWHAGELAGDEPAGV